jgi:PKD repeat protein
MYTLITLCLTILSLTAAPLNPYYFVNTQTIQAIPTITVTTNKQSYYIREEVNILGNLTSGVEPVTDALVAMEIRGPEEPLKPISYRTIPIGNPTGPLPGGLWEVNITEASIRDWQTGNPLTSVNIEDNIKINAKVYNNLAVQIHVVVAISIYDENMIPLFSTSTEGDIAIHRDTSFTWTFQIPNWAYPGRAALFCNVYSKLPAEGGIPYTPEKSFHFYITRNKNAGFPYSPLKSTYTSSPGKYATFLRLSPDRYNTPGNYKVYTTARVLPHVTQATTMFSVQYEPCPPQAAFTYSPLKAYANMSILFDASSSSAEGFNDTIIRYEWRINDPYNMEHLIYTGNFTHPPNPKTSHTFEYGGTYIVELNVTDNEGLWSTTSKPITILPEFGPTANFTWYPKNPVINQTVLFDASQSTTGWCARTQRFSPITSYSWNFSDGTGIWNTPNSTINHTFTRARNYTVKLTVTDADGRSHTTYNLVSIQNKTLKQYDITGPGGVPDGKIDIRDITLVAVNFGKTVPPADPRADVTGPSGAPDGKVDIRDVTAVARVFGQDP